MQKVAIAFGIGKSIVSIVSNGCETYHPVYFLSPRSSVHQTSPENTTARMSEIARQFEGRHGFSQCIEAIEGTHIGIKKVLENVANYFDRKETYTMSIHACADFKYCFFNVVIRWPGSVNNAGIFSNSAYRKSDG